MVRSKLSDHKNHLLVAGTGRAGTTVLIRYLTELGLETHLSRNGEASAFDDMAKAGLEDLPLSALTPHPPYVVKSPWSYLVVQEMLDDPKIALDGVVVPIRDLTAAVASRTVRQLQAVHQEAPWMSEMATTWEHWAMTPGGTVFSLNPIDEARLLAVGFHRLIERLVQADVPILFLAFPRFVTDPDYLYRKLAPLLRVDIPIELAREIHATVCKATNVRVERELGNNDGGSTDAPGGFQYPTFSSLDNAALKREVKNLRAQLSETQKRCTELVKGRNSLLSKMEAGEAHAAAAEVRYATLESERNALHDQLQCQAAAAEVRCATLESERNALHDQLQRQLDKKSLLTQEVLALRASRSWRLTRPFRVMTSTLSHAARIKT